MVEILVALTVAAIAIIGIMALYMTETKAGGFSRHSTEASVLAQDKIEQLRTQGNAVPSSTTEALINERGGLPGTGIFNRISTVTVGANFASIVVTVNWNDEGLTTAHSITVQARRDLP